MSTARRYTAAVSLAALGAFVLAACASSGNKASGGNSNSGGPTTGSASAASCAPATLKTHTANTLTIATDSPAYDPWFNQDKPSNGKGYESAVAFAVARQLGYTDGQVKWVVAAFNSVISNTPKKYDFDVNQVSITPERAKAVDFSSGYFDVSQVVITMKSSKIHGVTTIDGLKNAKLGAQKGTTSLDAILNTIKPAKTPGEYPTNDIAVQALKNGQIDGLVVDLPTGFYITSAELDNSEIVGQLPVTGTHEQFGLVLEKNSPLTSCVSNAVDTLRSNGTLAKLQQQWLAGAGAPVLK